MKTINRHSKVVIISLLIVVQLFSLSGNVFAETGLYKKLQTPFFQPDEIADSCSTTIVPVAGLPEDIVNNINQLKSSYQAAESETGVPWQLIAAVHFRESGNNPNGDLQAGNPYGGPYEQASTAYATYGKPANATESAIIAAKMLIAKAKSGVVNKPINEPNPDPEAIKDALFGYNGRAKVYAQQAASLGFDPETQPYEGSPYVMSRFDAKHENMRLIQEDFGGLAGIDSRLGAYTVYSLLGGNTTSNSSTFDSCVGGAVAGSIVLTAIRYSWPEYHEPNYFVMVPAYERSVNAARNAGLYVGGGENPGIDCGGFVTRVMQDSGVDPEYNIGKGNTNGQIQYVESHPEKYKKLEGITGSSNLMPGDIAINGEHTFIYVGNQPGFEGNSASASFSDSGSSWRTPMATTYTNFEDYNWYRVIQ